MEKSKTLTIGCGGCGCNQLSTLLGLDRRYTGIFMNTNLSEMEGLPNFDKDRNCFYIPNADGTGKNRDLAEQYIKEEAPKFVEMIKKYVNQDTFYFLSSLNGGTGSKAIILLSKLIKKVCPEKSINILGTFPSLSEHDIDFENTIDTWNEIIELKRKSIIDTIQFIDNNKYTNEKKINLLAMKEFDAGFNIVGGKLDSSDSRRVHHSKGYKVILQLNDSISDTKDAIDQAIESSVFYMPDNFECDVVVGNINSNKFDLNAIKNEFEAYDFTKFNEDSTTTNTLVLGGCEMPKEPIELVREALKEIKKKKKKRVVEEDLIIKYSTSPKEEKIKEVETKTRLSSKDLNDMFKDDSFWND